MDGKSWPLLLRLEPAAITGRVAAILLGVWVSVIVVDVVMTDPTFVLWEHMFNRRPVEFMQWLLLPAAALCSTYLSARLPEGDQARFFFLLAIGLTLMLIEDAGDVRHAIRPYVVAVSDQEVLGMSPGRVFEVSYFAALAAIPVYVLIRYWRTIWANPQARFYLVSGYALYAVAGAGSPILGPSGYATIGEAMDRYLFAGNLSLPGREERGWELFLFVDGPIEETLETMAAGMLLAMALVFAQARVQSEARQPDCEHIDEPESSPDSRLPEPLKRNDTTQCGDNGGTA